MNARQKLDRWWRGRVGPIPTPERWVFVVGCYNSGTTLLHALLAEHPAVGSLPTEGQFLTDGFVLPREVGLPRQWALRPDLFRMTERDSAKVDADRIKRQWSGRFDDADRPVLIEHSPPNAGRTRWLEQNFVPASFVGIVRDGFAVSEGIRRRAGHSLTDAALQWATSNQIMLTDFEQVERSILVRYEELTERPDEVIASILDFLGLAPGATVTAGREFSIHDVQSSIRNMNDRSLTALTNDERREIEGVAGPMLRRLGYA